MFWFIMCASASLAIKLHTAASKNGPPKAFCGKKKGQNYNSHIKMGHHFLLNILIALRVAVDV